MPEKGLSHNIQHIKNVIKMNCFYTKRRKEGLLCLITIEKFSQTQKININNRTPYTIEQYQNRDNQHQQHQQNWSTRPSNANKYFHSNRWRIQYSISIYENMGLEGFLLHQFNPENYCFNSIFIAQVLCMVRHFLFIVRPTGT